ncbi:MAG TPA: RICIN domain-containing protein, partial [Polyangiaceae bacterium]|nr:RICIN domain-containing protein [Polyangiaceae bacterium]
MGDSRGVRGWLRLALGAALALAATTQGCAGAESSNRSTTGGPDSGDGGDGGDGGDATDSPAPADATTPADARAPADSPAPADATTPADSAATDSSRPGIETGPDVGSNESPESGAPSAFNGAGTYEIVNVGNGAALNVANGGTVEGTRTVTSAAENTTSEQWTFAYAGEGLYTVQ